MGSVRVRKETGLLFFDFVFQGKRCREQSTLKDTQENRRKMEKMLERIEAEIVLKTFEYAKYFPTSPAALKFSGKAGAGEEDQDGVPQFKTFCWEWFNENTVRWKRSYRAMVKGILEKRLEPHFGDKKVSRITKSDILKFRSSLAKVRDGEKGLSPDRINHIMTPLRMMLDDAADRYDFTTPFLGLKQLPVSLSQVDPFSLEEVVTFLSGVRADFKDYYTVRFFSGMRTAEIDGLQWPYVDFHRREILIRETLVKGHMDTTKTQASARTIAMSEPVYQALKRQFEITGEAGGFVFCSRAGGPLNYTNVASRIWYPTLQKLGLKKRRPYQTRHTSATLWLGAGENPEWIARQMGHTTTKMLFTIYSRFVPNLTRKDGSAIENLLANKMDGGNHD